MKDYRISGPTVGVGPGLRASQGIIIFFPDGIRRFSGRKGMPGAVAAP